MVDSDLAYLVGALRDGSVFYDRAARNYNVIWYSKFKEYLESSIKPRAERSFDKTGRLEMYKPGHWRYKLSGLSTYNYIRSTFEFPSSPLGQVVWNTPSAIKDAGQEAKIYFLKGVFDAEGDVSLPNKYVEVSQKNTDLLWWAKRTLAKLGIPGGRVVVADRDSMTCKIVVASKSGVRDFAQCAGFERPEKKTQLAALMELLKDYDKPPDSRQ